MPDEVPMVTSCPLCLAPDEVESMVTVQIERAIPKGRAAIMICRNCTFAVIEAAAQLEPPLLSTLLAEDRRGAVAAPASEESAPEDEPDVAPEGIERVPHSHTSRSNEEPR